MSTNQNFSHLKKEKSTKNYVDPNLNFVVLRLKTEFSYISDFEIKSQIFKFLSNVNKNWNFDLFFVDFVNVNFTYSKKLRLK